MATKPTDKPADMPASESADIIVELSADVPSSVPEEPLMGSSLGVLANVQPGLIDEYFRWLATMCDDIKQVEKLLLGIIDLRHTMKLVQRTIDVAKAKKLAAWDRSDIALGAHAAAEDRERAYKDINAAMINATESLEQLHAHHLTNVLAHDEIIKQLHVLHQKYNADLVHANRIIYDLKCQHAESKSALDADTLNHISGTADCKITPPSDTTTELQTQYDITDSNVLSAKKSRQQMQKQFRAEKEQLQGQLSVVDAIIVDQLSQIASCNDRIKKLTVKLSNITLPSADELAQLFAARKHAEELAESADIELGNLTNEYAYHDRMLMTLINEACLRAHDGHYTIRPLFKTNLHVLRMKYILRGFKHAIDPYIKNLLRVEFVRIVRILAAL